MATQGKRQKTAGSGPDKSTNVNPEEVLRPFHEAAVKLAEANAAAHGSAIRKWAQSCIDFQNEARRIEQEAYNSIMEVNKKYFNAMGQEAAGSFEEIHASRTKLQQEYENEIREVYGATQNRLAELAQGAGGEDGGDAFRQLNDQRQEAYQAYLADLRQAWAEIPTVDPQAMNAVALHILSTINSCHA